MNIKPSTQIRALLRIYPQLEEVLEDHDLDVNEIDSKSIRRACNEADLDVEEVVADLKASLRDSATEGWLVGDNDEDESVDDDSEEDSDDYEDEDEEEEDDYYDEDSVLADDDDVDDIDEDEGDEDDEDDE